MADINVQTPGLLTVVQANNYPVLKGHGYEWISFQHWNRGQRGPMDWAGDYNLNTAKEAGFASAGVWGVLYEDEDGFQYEIGRGMGGRAKTLGADHLMLDIEYTTVATRLLQGIRDGGWTKPVHLTCLGAPDKKPDGSGYWDYNYDLKTFLDTGGGIFPQAYFNQWPGYRPLDTVKYYVDQLHVPKERVNLMIWPNGTLSGDVWLGLLREAGLERALSIFLAETTSETDYLTLDALTKVAPQPPQPPARTVEDVRQDMLRLVDEGVALLRAKGLTDAQINNQRIPLSGHLLRTVQDASWVAKRDEFKRLWNITP